MYSECVRRAESTVKVDASASGVWRQDELGRVVEGVGVSLHGGL
jgi:hypothetical protein